MQPAVGDHPEGAGLGRGLVQFDFDVMVPGQSLILASTKIIQIPIVQRAHDVGYFLAAIIPGPRKRTRRCHSDKPRVWAGA